MLTLEDPEVIMKRTEVAALDAASGNLLFDKNWRFLLYV